MTDIKTTMKLPKFSPLQVGTMIGAVIFFIVTNTNWFQNLDAMVKVIAYVAVILAVVFIGLPTGAIITFVGAAIKVLAGDGSQEEKVIQLQNLLVALCQELGIYYERERQKALEAKRAELEQLNKELEYA